MPSNVHAEGLPDVNPQSTSLLSSMVNRVSNSDAFDVEMPPVDEVVSVALDSLESVDEASGLPSSSSMAPNAHAGVSDSVPPDLPPVPPRNHHVLKKFILLKYLLFLLPVMKGSLFIPLFQLPLVSLLVVMVLFQLPLVSLLVVMVLFQLALLEGQTFIPPRILCFQ